MASINSYPDAENLSDVDEPTGVGPSRSRGGRRPRKTAKRQRLKSSRRIVSDGMAHGWPKWAGLKPIVMFLMFPAAFAMLIILTGGSWSPAILYPVAAVFGLYVVISAFTGVELTLACLLLYLPFSKTYVIPLAPGLNGTNMLLLLGLFAAVMSASNNRQSLLHWPTGTGMVVAFGFITGLSGFTIMSQPGGYAYLLYEEVLNYKAWLEQFVFFFVALCAIRDRETAKRVVLYMCFGAIVLVLYAVPEMLNKMGRASIEQSRIGGPQQQSNNFGGFVAYTVLPIGALFLMYIKDYRAWFITPYFLIAAKVLISTFSRGAYLAIAVGAMLATYFKGKGFLIVVGTLALAVLLAFPSLIPESILIRMQSITENTASTSTPDKLDKSSETRLIMWRAAAKMTVESPVLGKGFKGFQKLKEQYTEQSVFESDPHSMYLYISSQMGLPALALFLLILAYAFHMGRYLSNNREDLFVRAVGVGGAAAAVCYAIICIFGSRAVNLEFTAYFWTYFICMQVMRRSLIESDHTSKPKKKRASAFNPKQPLTHQNAPEALAEWFSDAPVEEEARRLTAPRQRLNKNRLKRLRSSQNRSI